MPEYSKDVLDAAYATIRRAQEALTVEALESAESMSACIRDVYVEEIAGSIHEERLRCAEIADDCPFVIDDRLCPGSERSAYIMGWDAALQHVHDQILKGED